MIRKSTNYKYTESVFCKSTSLSFRDPKKFSHIMRATREREIFQTSTAWNNQSRLGLTPKHPSIAQKCCLVGFGPNSLVIHTNQQEADQQWEKPPLCAPLCFVGNVVAPPNVAHKSWTNRKSTRIGLDTANLFSFRHCEGNHYLCETWTLNVCCSLFSWMHLAFTASSIVLGASRAGEPLASNLDILYNSIHIVYLYIMVGFSQLVGAKPFATLSQSIETSSWQRIVLARRIYQNK